MWAMSAGIAVSLQMGSPWRVSSAKAGAGNPLTGTYRTRDGRHLCFVMLQAFHYWPDFCRHVGRDEWIDDPRFDSYESLTANHAVAEALIGQEIAKRTLDEWSERFETLQGQWCRVQDTLEVAADPQTRANGYVQQTTTRDGRPFELVTTPVQFDGEPAPTHRSPEFNEHGDEILLELGFDMDRILELKAAGAVT
jgi:crotonobetainyl-CoA:carnitine CoA-transferase CaiB-like acyl-CoA transferase